MIKGVKIRFEIHNILFSIYKFNKTLNEQNNISLYDEKLPKSHLSLNLRYIILIRLI